MWVATILMKQIERRECFDVEYLARQLVRIRPGAFSDPMSFFVLFGLAFRIASLGGWSAYEVSHHFSVTTIRTFAVSIQLTAGIILLRLLCSVLITDFTLRYTFVFRMLRIASKK